MKPRRGKPSLELEATVHELAPGGDGVAIAVIEGERRAVFMAGVVPGDRVRVAVDLAKRPARGVVREVLTKSPDRVEARCAWVGACGGCDWMHVSHAAQLRAHEAHLRAALPSAWREHAIAVHPAANEFAYRTRTRVHVQATGGRAIVGMNEARTRDPVEVDVCAVLHPALEAARARVASLLEGAHGRGEVQIALGSMTESMTGSKSGSSHRPAVIDLQWSGMLAPRCFAQIDAAVKDGWLAGARITAGETRVPAKIGDATPWIEAGDGAPLKLAPGGFGQASDEGNVALARRVAAIVEGACANKPDARVLELYAGAGNFTVMLASLAKSVVAVESSREACDAARVNLVARGVEARAKIVEADASAYEIPKPIHVVVLDPPRTGAREACTRLVSSSAKHIVYVSCDTPTLARDLAILAPSFTPRSIDLFELFPQTSHVESVVHLVRERP